MEKTLLKYDIIISDIELVYSHVTSSNWSYNPKSSGDEHVFIFTTGGEANLYIKNKHYIAVPNTISYIPPLCNYRSNGNVCWEYISVSFKTLNDFEYPNISIFKPANPLFYKNYFEKILDEWSNMGIASFLSMKSFIYDLLKNILIENIRTTSSSYEYSLIKKSIEFINDECFNGNIAINDLAKLSNISTNHYRRVFQKVFKTTPLKYINHLRITKAKELLDYSMLNIEEIVFKTGFDNIYYFSKAFKQYVGISPTHYRFRNKK